MKFFIHSTKLFLEQNISFSNQSKWEFLKYEIRKKCVSFSKVLVQKSRKQHANLLCKITKLEQDIDGEENLKNMTKQEANLKKYMIKLQKVWKFEVNVLGINMVKNLQNFSMG